MTTDVQKLDRLREQEKLERDERRGLETRASASIAALLVATGLAFNAGSPPDTTYAVAAGICVALAFLLSFMPLIGLHATEAEGACDAIKEAIRGAGPPEIKLPEDDPADELERQHRRVTKLVEANVAAVRCLRLAGLLTVLAAYCVLYGLLIA